MINKNLFFQKVSKIADAIIAFCATNRIWFFGLALWTISIIFTTESETVSWGIFLPVFGFLVMIFSPVLLFTLFRNPIKRQFPKYLFYVISSLIFIVYPAVLLLTNTHIPLNNLGVFEFHKGVHNNEEVLYYLIFYVALLFVLIEVFLNLKNNWTIKWRIFKQLKKLTLEQTLLILIFFFSILVALIELISQDMTPNSFPGIPLFFVNWLFLTVQLFIMMFIYYLFYWVNHYILINKVLKHKGILTYTASFMFIVLVFYPIAAQLVYWVSSIRYWGMKPIMIEGSFHGVNFIFPFMGMLLSIPFILAIQWSKQSNEIATLEKGKSDAELNLLKQQINPHFFFNTLNNLYALSLKKDEATPEVILQLSELMRYVIYKGKEETVQLKEELKYIEDYCELQQIRLYKKIAFEFSRKIENDHLQIPPLLFIILVENAFKHGIEPAEGDCYLDINLESDENSLTFICENSYEAQETETAAGIGLENLKQRLKLRFPNQHNLKITKTETTYRVELQITLIDD